MFQQRRCVQADGDDTHQWVLLVPELLVLIVCRQDRLPRRTAAAAAAAAAAPRSRGNPCRLLAGVLGETVNGPLFLVITRVQATLQPCRRTCCSTAGGSGGSSTIAPSWAGSSTVGPSCCLWCRWWCCCWCCWWCCRRCWWCCYRGANSSRSGSYCTCSTCSAA